MSSTGISLVHAVVTAIVGLIVLVIPRISRTGLLFGVYIGEEAHRSEAARELRARWTLETWPIVLIAVVGALAAGPAGLGGWARLAPLVLLIGVSVTYLRAHAAARTMAVESHAPAVAVIDPAEHRSVLPALVFTTVLVIGAVVLAHAIIAYPGLPEQIPTHFDAGGTPDAWSDKSLAAVLLLPLMALFIGGFTGLFALLMTGAKRSLRHPRTGVSLEAQTRFRTAVSRFLAGIALLVTGMLGLMSIGQIETAQGHDNGIMIWGVVLSGLMFVFAIGGAIYLMVRYGQGGSRLEADAATGAAGPPGELTDGLADNRLWKLGVFYLNPDDPSIFVEKRFGLGYTFNFANPKAIGLIVGFLVLITVVVVLASNLG